MTAANAVLLSDQSVNLLDHGIDTIPLQKAEEYLNASSPSVIGAHCRPANLTWLLALLRDQKLKSPRKQVIILHEDLTSLQLCEINNSLHPAMVLPFADTLNWTQLYADCFDKYFELEQKQKLTELVNEKNEKLKKLMIGLEIKVEERQLQLEESRLKNIEAARKLAILKKTLVQIYQATSIREIEHGIASALKAEFNISWVNFRGPSQTNFLQKMEESKYFKVALKSGSLDFGHLLFFREEGENFNASEKRFLAQVGDAVTLSIERTYQYTKSQELKRQWEATFDAISDPICLTDEKYNILRINSGFLQKTKTEDFYQHLGQKCYQSLFGRTEPCEGCDRGKIFQVRNPRPNKSSEVYEVYSNNLGEEDRTVYFQMYRDITQDLNLQRQVVETAKMAELGTISSSIAHELNNPIGGMLNFIQLMKMDLNGKEDFYPDIIEIEKAAVRCKDIVKNLLGFSRKSFNAEVTEVHLQEVIEQAIRITELKTRSIGITIQRHVPEQDVIIQGRFNLLTHAVRNILQNAQESLIEKRKHEKSFTGIIRVELEETANAVELRISDNGDGIAPETRDKIFDPLYTTKDPETNPGLGLTLALQIVEEHFGSINVTTDNNKNLCFKLRFFKPEGQSGESAF